MRTDIQDALGGINISKGYSGPLLMVESDVPAHAYTFSFEPNPEWDCFFAYAPQIKAVSCISCSTESVTC
jgi:hypothetical protein